jgi:uncharacterized protein YrrD
LSLYSGSALLARNVLLRGIRLGEIEDLLLDAAGRRLLGFVVLCGDGARRMLPLAAADVADEGVLVASAFVLMDDGFYRGRCRAFAELVGAPVLRGGEAVGTLTDVLVDGEGRILLLDVGGLGEIATSEGVTIDPEARTRAV